MIKYGYIVIGLEDIFGASTYCSMKEGVEFDEQLSSRFSMYRDRDLVSGRPACPSFISTSYCIPAIDSCSSPYEISFSLVMFVMHPVTDFL